MKAQQLRSFISVVECGSFSRAEEMAYLSKGALKKQIDSLEKELGFALLKRTNTGVQTTPAGQFFFAAAQDLLRHMERITEQGRAIAAQENTLRIANPPQPRMLLEPAFQEFGKRHPEIRQKIVHHKELEDISTILDGTFDITETILREELLQPGLGYTPLSPMPFKCLMLDTHPLASRTLLRMEDLSGQQLGMSHINYLRLADDLRSRCRNITLIDTGGTDMSSIYSVCFNQGIYLSIAYFGDKLHPITAVPLETDLLLQSVILYRTPMSLNVQKFVAVVEELFPQIGS